MGEAFTILFSWPTVFWTVPMCVVLVYWLLVILGFLGIDLIPFDIDGDVDGPDVGLDGGIDGGGWLSSAFSLGVVPITISVSVLIFCAWAFTFFFTSLLGASLVGIIGSVLFVLLMLAASLTIALIATSLAIRPLRRGFAVRSIRGGNHLVGRIVTITSSKVTNNFGIATYRVPEHAGTELTLNVVQTGEHPFAMGDEAVVVGHDDAAGEYTVAPLPRTDDGIIAAPAATPLPAPTEAEPPRKDADAEADGSTRAPTPSRE